MAKKNKKSLDWRSYLIQLSLIIFSILIALGVDRCAQKSRNNERLEAYMVVMEQELIEEQESAAMNIFDATKDVRSLREGLAILPEGVDSLTEKTLRGVVAVFIRGVFRDFPPLTYERMAAANDAFLITDLNLRRALEEMAAFRTDYVQYDLRKYDEMVLETVDRYTKYLNIGCIIQKRGDDLLNCIKDKEALRLNGGADLTTLQAMAQTRLFHLEQYAGTIENAQRAFAAYKGEPWSPENDSDE